jgi:hypothetical protein
MSKTQISLTPDEIGRRGEEIYEQTLRDLVEAGNVGKYIAIDIHTGEYEVGDDHLGTVNRLHARQPAAEVYTIKIGYPATAVIGGRLKPNTRSAA